MKLKPLLTEKTLSEAKKNWYTFLLSPWVSKKEGKNLIEKLYKVKILKIASSVAKKIVKKTSSGKRKTIPSYKKIVVKLNSSEKITLFHEGNKK